MDGDNGHAAVKRPRQDDAMPGGAGGDAAKKRAMLAMLAVQQQCPQPPPEEAAGLPSVPGGDNGHVEAGDAPAPDTWGEDVAPDDVFPFERTEEGQDYDHLLDSSQQHWESTNQAKRLPPGWAKCPNAGDEVFGLIPIKAPYGRKAGQMIPLPYQWKPSDVVQHVHSTAGRRLGLLVDLTMTDKYYNAAMDLQGTGVQYLKIPCRGHGEVPTAANVNMFFWEVRKHMMTFATEWPLEKHWLADYDRQVEAYLAHQATAGDAKDGRVHPSKRLGPAQRLLLERRDLVAKGPKAIAVHCTHGFNRSGFMLVHYAMRVWPALSVAECITRFQAARAPGIYKDEYIQALFEYYHQERVEFGPGAVLTPLMPAWKPDDGSPEHFQDAGDEADAAEAGGQGAGMQHDDNIGEPVPDEEADMYKHELVKQIRAAWLELHGDDLPPRERQMRQNNAQRLEFPGSQPVSLSSSNQGIVALKRYWFTWKADGTRYLMYLSNSGTYIVDRRMRVTRVQGRFPLWQYGALDPNDTDAWLATFDAGKLPKPALHKGRVAFHHGTLLDGEMVVDTHPDGRQERVFYVYDLMMLNGRNVIARHWKQRFMFINEVVEPRKLEAKLIADPAKKWPHRYFYAQEPFSVCLKQFWPLHKYDSVARSFIPKLLHENDGLILQSYESEYVPDACPDLLKWKPSSHNSVDFKLLHATDPLVLMDDACLPAVDAGQDYFLGVYLRGKVVVAFALDPGTLEPLAAPAAVRFPEGEDAAAYVGVVIECNYDAAAGVWCFMRERSKDKETPNAFGTYQKVMQSINDAMDEEHIRQQFELAYMVGQKVYAKDASNAKREEHVRLQVAKAQQGRPHARAPLR